MCDLKYHHQASASRAKFSNEFAIYTTTISATSGASAAAKFQRSRDFFVSLCDEE